MRSFKEGDKVKVIKASLPSFWYADKIGSVFTLRKLVSYGKWAIEEDHTSYLAPEDIELAEQDKPFVLEEHPLESYPSKDKPDKDTIVQQDMGKHYRHSFRLNLTEEDVKNGFVMVNVDPYRISEVYNLGGWREHVVKKTLRNTDKGHSQEELIAELQCCLDRAKQIMEESKG